MKNKMLHAFMIAMLPMTAASCLSLGTQSVGTGGEGGAGGEGNGGAEGGAGTGGSPIPGCPDCTYGRRYGDDEKQAVYSIALAENGSVFVSGKYDGAMFLGPNVGLTDGQSEGEQPFLAKLDRWGTPQWIVNPTGHATKVGEGSIVAIANGVVAWGGSIETNAFGEDMFVETRSLNEGSSTVLGKAQLGSPALDNVTSVALSTDGKTVFVAGVLGGAAQSYTGCPTMAPFDAGPDANVVVLALDSALMSCKWGKTWTGGYHNPGTIKVAVAPDGHPVVTGAYSDGTLSGTGLPSGNAAFLLKLDAETGNLMGAKGFANVYPLAIAADASTNRIVVAGVLYGAITFANQAKSGPVMPDDAHAVILAYDSGLQEKWLRVFDGPKAQYCQDISSDGAGRLYAGCINVDNLPIPNGGPTIACGSDTLCGVLLPMTSDDGELDAKNVRAFGMGHAIVAGGLFLTAATPNALAIGATWMTPMTMYDGAPLTPMGVDTDYDVLIGKVEPPPGKTP